MGRHLFFPTVLLVACAWMFTACSRERVSPTLPAVEADTLCTFARRLEAAGQSDSAFQYYRRAAELLRGSGKHERLAEINNAMGAILLDHDLTKEALNHMQTALSHALKTYDTTLLSSAYRGVAGIYGYQGDLETSMSFYQKALCLSNHVSTSERSCLYNNLARIQLISGELDSALYFNKLAILTSPSDILPYNDYYARGRIFECMEQTDSAIHYYLLAVKGTDLSTKVAGYRCLVRLSSIMNLPDSAFYARQQIYWDDSLTWTKKTVEIGKLSHDWELSTMRHDYYNKALVAAICLFALFVVVSLLILWKRHHRRLKWQRFIEESYRISQELEARKAELENARNHQENLVMKNAELLTEVQELQVKWNTHLERLSCSFDSIISHVVSLKDYIAFIENLDKYRTSGVLPHTRRTWIEALIQKQFESHLYLLETIYGLSTTYAMFYCYTRLQLETWQISLCMGCTQETIRSYRSRIKTTLLQYADGIYLLKKAFPDKV